MFNVGRQGLAAWAKSQEGPETQGCKTRLRAQEPRAKELRSEGPRDEKTKSPVEKTLAQ